MSSDLWRWADPNGQQRIVRLDELRAALAGGHVAPNAPVWRSGWVAWQSANEVPELQSSALSAANGVVPNIPPPPLAMVAVQQAFEATGEEAFALGAPADHRQGDDAPPPPPPPNYVPDPVKPSPPTVPPSSRRGANAPGGEHTPRPPVLQMPSSLPTTVGLPPPPELLAAVQARAASARPSASSREAPRTPASVPSDLPPLGPVVCDEESRDVSRESIPSDRGLPWAAILDDVNAVRAGRAPKNRIRLGVLAFLALMAFIALLALVVGALRGKPSELSTAEPPLRSPAIAPAPLASGSGGSAPAEPASTARAPTGVVAVPEPQSKPDATLGDCVLAGEGRVVARRVFLPAGVEVAAPGPFALGFATDPQNGVAITVDAATLSVTSTVKARAVGGPALRTSPLFDKGKLLAVPDVEKKDDKIRVRRVVATIPAIDVGVAENSIVWAPHGRSAYSKLFAIEGEGAIEALRAVPLAAGGGIALAFRRGNAVFVGVAKGREGLVAEGALARLPGLGQVGSPSVTTSGDTIVAAWSDRATANDPWQVRWTKLKPAEVPDPPHTFSLPQGGLGSQAMSPSVAGLGDGRFVIAWSEGTSSHQVRAQSVDANGLPSGAVLTLSAPGINAGQPQVAVGSGGRGVVAFLAANGKAYELVASPVSCAAK